ncbi:Gfo/Idh/MocA family oxidoreductase [Pseudaeromonas sp. ZJS20]|uniref:Gfo/Idh/MocA family oxidoreductase n=1 Tax=Pseudaeromonas aegiceratis TaxID=3153928 RepID=UPI00390C640A
MLGFIGLGGVVETAYLPALRRLLPAGVPLWGFDADPARQLAGIERLPTQDALLAKPLAALFITTPPASHWTVLRQALASPVPCILVEKPLVATLAEIDALQSTLADGHDRGRVLALDHWAVRVEGIRDLLDSLPPECRQAAHGPLARIEGYLEEPSGLDELGVPCALNFATGAPDRRQLRHPDGVVLDTGTHVLALLRECMALLGQALDLQLTLATMNDRRDVPIAPGDHQTAEGRASLQGRLGGVPVSIRLDKYAGVAGGRKGLTLYGEQGWQLSLDRQGDEDRIVWQQGAQRVSLRRPGAIYGHALAEVLGVSGGLDAAQRQAMTARRLEEVRLLLQLQQDWRGEPT